MSIDGAARDQPGAEEERVGRYVRMAAHPGEGAALADALLNVAGNMRQAPGCEMYVVNLSADEPDIVWVTELWSDALSSDRALGGELGQVGLEDVVTHLAAPPELIAVRPLGGVGLPTG
ncbi:putative quinol monooxygenase [Pseudonocardia sp. MH-G8]|uniref:putative quinol monooxygenase n=1 Tax=Pseudonocardia sp. MH-G8 TaxID=1854588 RepID=UPI001179B349|nr:antibiotic biosynthesis monooxygenase family protein [Pseudonocardia sp. MH-G8]